ncbi:hypothetical protein F5890DRAFT_1518235 [Lentinula detonsa]|uniref:DUF7918 domain-containing protein n=1 Tax=Lentinula detonsa TaxID=2804962 RepID=A0AA38URM8_9AGAR|nr:hypothetical protein F5890DRAFT_1518235 [Lentinula detonsa]
MFVFVDGVGLETHCAEASHSICTASTSGWISSEAGKKFSVYWHNAERDITLEAVVSIDGVECNRHVMLAAKDFPDRPDTVRVSYTRTSESTRRDFIFSVIKLTDDDEWLPLVDYTKFGVITLELWRLRVNRVVRQQLQHDCYKPLILEPQVLHEQTKRSGIHHVRFGEEYNVSRPTVDMVDGQKMDRVPYASFLFRYRPRDMLLAQGVIAPRSIHQVPITRLLSDDAPPTEKTYQHNRFPNRGQSVISSRRVTIESLLS